MGRTKQFGKRKYFGNQCQTVKKAHAKKACADELNNSASGKKIDTSEEINDVNCTENVVSNIIIEIGILRSLVNNISKCKYCGNSSCFDVREDVCSRKGLAVNLMLHCTKCNNSTNAMTSTMSKCYNVNNRLVYALRCIGKGQRAAQIFCGVMNLPPPPAKFARYKENLLNSLSIVCKESIVKAVDETVQFQNGNRDIVAAFDGTWQKRGHTSLNGVVCATSLDNGKVIDFECLSKYCFKCRNKDINNHDCQKNFDGYSGGMEGAGVLSIFARSESLHNVRYVKYLGDGDSKAFSKVCDAKIYGEGIQVEKLECIGHMQKRMGSRLRSLRNDLKKKKLADGKTISGRGRLTDLEINKLQNYYGLAIRRNTDNSVDDMVKSIWAIYFHRLSTDDQAHHGLCPSGPDTWCQYNKAQETGEEYTHHHALPEAVLTAIKPIFRSLSDRKLLEKCMHGRTQNPNESFNNCIWERVPKTNFVSIDTVKIGVMDAVICFNDGMYSRVKVLEDMGISPGINMRQAFRKIDRTRICEAEIKVQKHSKEARKQKMLMKKKVADAEMCTQNEYKPGMF